MALYLGIDIGTSGTRDDTKYGGDTSTPGTATRQEFPADIPTASIVPTTAANVWTLEIKPDSIFAYDLRSTILTRHFSA